MNPIEFPASIPLDDLCKCNAKYNPIDERTGVDVLTKHRDLYVGGAEFYKRINNYLVPRAFEEASTGAKSLVAVPYGTDPMYDSTNVVPTENPFPATQRASNRGGMTEQYKRRAKRSAYAPIGSGMIDFMKAAIFQEEPALLVDSAVKDAKYWNRLNVDCDGRGNTIDSVLQEVMQGVFLDFRSYILLCDPSDTREGLSQKDTGALDTKISYLSAREVGDWEYDAKGNLSWIRIDRCNYKRSQPWNQPDIEERIWTFLTAERIFEYKIQWLIEDGKPDDNPPVPQTVNKAHGLTYFGAPTLPVIPIPIQSGLWLMDRLADIILAIFNRQSACTWSLDQMAFAILVIISEMTKEKIGDMKLEDISGLKLNLQNDAKFVAPEVGIHDAQLKDIDRLISELSLVIQAMVLVAAAKDDQGRKSGIAKKLDFSALTTLLSAYAGPVRKAVERAVQIIKEHRDETDVPIAVEGLKEFSVESAETLIELAAKALGLKGIPVAAKQWLARKTGLKITDDAPEDVRQEVIAQSKAMIEEDFAETPKTIEPDGDEPTEKAE